MELMGSGTAAFVLAVVALVPFRTTEAHVELVPQLLGLRVPDRLLLVIPSRAERRLADSTFRIEVAGEVPLAPHEEVGPDAHLRPAEDEGKHPLAERDLVPDFERLHDGLREVLHVDLLGHDTFEGGPTHIRVVGQEDDAKGACLRDTGDEGIDVLGNALVCDHMNVDLDLEGVLQRQVVLDEPVEALERVEGHRYPTADLVGRFDDLRKKLGSVGRVVGHGTQLPSLAENLREVWMLGRFTTADGDLVGRHIETLDHLLDQFLRGMTPTGTGVLVAVVGSATRREEGRR